MNTHSRKACRVPCQRMRSMLEYGPVSSSQDSQIIVKYAQKVFGMRDMRDIM